MWQLTILVSDAIYRSKSSLHDIQNGALCNIHQCSFSAAPATATASERQVKQFPLGRDLQGGPAKVKPTYIFAGNVWYLNV